MTTIIAAIIAALPAALWAIAAKLLTQSFLQKLLERLLIAGLERAAKMTTNSVDDELVADVKSALQTPQQ